MWTATIEEGGERHVMPIDDVKQHEATSLCWCLPTDDAGVWVHHSIDGRELLERKCEN